VVIGEVHRKTQSEKCLIAIEKQRKVKHRDRKVYFVEGIPEGFYACCPDAPGAYQMRGSLRCIGWDGPESLKSSLRLIVDHEFRNFINQTLKKKELKDPLLFRLEWLTREEAEKSIHKFLNGLTLSYPQQTYYLSSQQTWADCKVPRRLSFGLRYFFNTFHVTCGVFERLENFLWTIHDLGLSKALERFQFDIYFREMEAHGAGSPTQMVLRNKGLAAKIREGLRDDEMLSTAFSPFIPHFPEWCYVGSQSKAFISAIAGSCPLERESTVFFAAIAGWCHVDARACRAEMHGTDKEVREAIEEGKDRLAVLVPARY
jgi:hypothetical protein